MIKGPLTAITGLYIFLSSARAGPVACELNFISSGTLLSGFSSPSTTHGVLRVASRIDTYFFQDIAQVFNGTGVIEGAGEMRLHSVIGQALRDNGSREGSPEERKVA